MLADRLIARCYFPKDVHITLMQLNGFSDTSESSYAGVIDVCMVDSSDMIHTSLVAAKTRVTPLKCLTVPCLELCGVDHLASLLHHVNKYSMFPPIKFLHGLTARWSWGGSQATLVTFVGNRVSNDMELVPPGCWQCITLVVKKPS